MTHRAPEPRPRGRESTQPTAAPPKPERSDTNHLDGPDREANGSDTADSEKTGVWWWVRTIVAWTLLVFLVGVLLASVVVPRVTGAETFTISTGSMKPKYPPGTLIVVRPTKAEDIGVGTVITYQLESGKATVVTHRVVASSFDGNGKRLLTTQGDANNTPDEKPVQPQQIRGALWYSVPYLGYINKVLSGGQRTIIFWVVFGALVVYALYMFGSSFLDRGKKGGTR
ncbi:hypothetical protein GCM10009624_05300 [Gordonia sinesedis]